MPSTAVARRDSAAGSLRAVPVRHPKAGAVLLLWLLGLWLAFMAKPARITEQQTVAFKEKLSEAEGVLAALTAAERRLMDAELDMRRHQVWFWRLKPEARREVEARRPAVDKAQAAVDAVRQRRDGLLREAKGALGLWSEAGVEESRELFWASYAAGKLFAQRQSVWDAAFTVIASRDRDLGLLLRLLFQTLFNFFTGMTVSVFVFLFRLPSLILSYQPALWSAAAFFCLAGVAAVSVIAAYLGLLFGAGATATYATLWMVAQQQAGRLQGGQHVRQRLEYGGGREHHD